MMRSERPIDFARRFLADESAATAIEYAMIAAGIAVAISATVYSIGGVIRDNYFGKIQPALEGSSQPGD